MAVIALVKRLDYVESGGFQRGMKVRVLHLPSSNDIDCSAH
jgi:hypothetical protein